jgi:hypothetical protein
MFVGIGVGIGRNRFAQGIFNAYNARVVADGGITEAGACVDAVSGLLLTASLLLIPSGYKSGKAYAEIPTNGNGDLTWTRASTALRTNSSGLLESMGSGVPRLSYMYGSCPALLLEPQRTNSIRNSIASGAVVGTPGTRPTNWEYTATAGLTIDIIQLGTIGALNYIDYRISGTATATSARLSFELSTQIAATVGQTWSYSLYAQSLTGSLPSSLLRFVERNSAGGALVTGDQAISVSSSFERFAYTRTTTNASCAYIVPELNFSVTSGTSYNFTFRIAQPQIELGAYSTTPILTTGSASATRIADSFSRNNIYTNGLITSSGGTWFVEFRNNITYQRDNTQGLFIGDSTSQNSGNQIIIRFVGGGTRLAIHKYVSGVTTNLYTTTTDTTKIAIKWNGSTADIFANGTKVVSATAFTETVMENLIGANGVPIFIQSMDLYSTPLSDSQCQTLTTL